MRYLASLLIALAIATPAVAADYYFSDCGFTPSSSEDEVAAAPAACSDSTYKNNAPDGCLCGEWKIVAGLPVQVCPVSCTGETDPGQRCNPWCLAPEARDGNFARQSFEAMMDDGAGATLTVDLAAGDTVRLCAGTCDGSGTATYYLDSHAATDSGGSCSAVRSVFDYEVDGPITITPYCDGTACETVILSGDADGDTVYDSGEATHLINTGDCDAGVYQGSRGGYTWLGDPNLDGVPNLVVEKASIFLVYDHNEVAGKTNTYRGVEWRYQGTEMWRCTGSDCDNVVSDGVGANGPDGINCANYDSGAIGVTRARGTVDIDHNLFHHLCFVALRANNNCLTAGGAPTQTSGCTDGVTAINFVDNRLWNVGGLFNSHQVRNVTIARNTVTDFTWGVGLEEQVVNTAVEDNTFACTGQYDTNIGGNAWGKCVYGIAVNDGDGPYNPSPDGCRDDGLSAGVCIANDIFIRRNKVYGSGAQHGNTAGPGFLVTGISWTAHNSSGGVGNSVIENNMIWYTQPSAGWDVSKVNENASSIESPLAVFTDVALPVRHNTIHTAGYPVVLAGGNHDFAANAIYDVHNAGGNEYPEVCVYSGTPAFTYDVIHPGSGTDAPVCVWDGSGAIDKCSPQDGSCATTYTCAQITSGTLGTGSTCGVCGFGGTTPNPPATWDLHLAPTDLVCRDRVPTALTLYDIDRQVRPQFSDDTGADEAPTVLVDPPIRDATRSQQVLD